MKLAVQKIIQAVKFCTEVLTLIKNGVITILKPENQKRNDDLKKTVIYFREKITEILEVAQ